MAELIPSTFPFTLDDPKMKKEGFQREFEVYTKLGSAYDEKVHVMCKPTFLRRNTYGNIAGGEYADFMIVHPQRGIIFLECKAGLMSYNATKGKWSRNKVELEKSPIIQAQDGMYGFKKLCTFPRNQKKINISNIPLIYGAIFPDTPKPNKFDFGSSVKPEMIIWVEDFNNLEKSLSKLFAINRGECNLGEEDKTNIKEILYGINFDTPFKKKFELGEERQEKLEFDLEQQNLLSDLEDNNKVIVKGLAGTGKTIVAAKTAIKEIYENKKILILTKKKGLCQFLKVQLNQRPSSKTNNIRIYSIDNFVKETAVRLNVPFTRLKKFPNQQEKAEHFGNYSPQRCQQIFDQYTDEKFDIVIVDEAQDFQQNWFHSLNAIVKDKGSIFFFYDPLQTTLPNTMLEILKKPNENGFYGHTLTKNYRNTSSISNLLSKLIKKYFPNEKLTYLQHSKFNPGRPPELIEANSFEEIIKKTIIKAKYLINEEKWKPMDIGVLGIDSMLGSKYHSSLSITKELTKELEVKVIGAWDYSLPYMDPKEVNDITYSDVESFKGLEKKVVILINFNEINKDSVQKIYTGLSRAKGDLIVISNQKSINQIKELL